MAGIRNEQLSAEFVEEAYKQQSSRALKHLIDVYIKEDINASYDVYHYVDDYIPLRFKAPTDAAETLYQPSSFKMELAADDAEETPEVSITLDPGDRTMIRRLRRSEGEVILRLSIVMGEQRLDDPLYTHREWGPSSMTLQTFSFKSTAVTLKLKAETFLTEPIPSTVMNPTIAPALFQNKRIPG